LALTVGTLGVEIMNSTAFLLLANSGLEVDENQEVELTFGSLNFYIGPSGTTRLSDSTKSVPSAGKAERMTSSGSSVRSSSKANSPVSLAATENLQGKLEEPDKIGQETMVEEAEDKSRDTAAEAAASPKAYTSYTLSSQKQQKKKTITLATRRSICKSTN
jgi:hypothetical protein